LCASEARRQRLLKKWRRGAAFVLLLGALGVAARGVAASGDCPNALPVCFQASTPARASEVNQNFAAIVQWIEQKLGPVGNADIQASNIAADELDAKVLRAGDVHSATLTTTSAATTASLSTGNINANDVKSKTLTATGALSGDSLTTGNVQANIVTANGSVNTPYLDATRLEARTFMRLPRLPAPPGDCTTDTLGLMYFDTQRTPGAAANDWQLPCVCLYYAGYGPRWRQFDNVDAECR
jgi:hypothetical protein